MSVLCAHLDNDVNHNVAGRREEGWAGRDVKTTTAFVHVEQLLAEGSVMGHRRILVVGGNSTIGNPLAFSLRQTGYETVATTRRNEADGKEKMFLDLSNPFLKDCSYHTAFICAAETSMEKCGLEPERTHHINVGAILHVARMLMNNGCRVVYFSSDKVFDGQEPGAAADKPYNPQGAYGRQKAEVEKELLARQGVVVRLSKVLGRRLPLFERWLEQWFQGKSVSAFTDYLFAPITVDMVVETSVRLLEADGIGGIYQLSASNDISYHTAALVALDTLNLRKDLVHGSTIPPEKVGSMHPNLFASLDGARVRDELGITQTTAETAVRQYFTGRRVL